MVNIKKNKIYDFIGIINHQRLTKKNCRIVLLSVLILTSLIASSTYIWRKINRPVAVVRIEGEFHHLLRSQIRQQLSPVVVEKFFSIKLSQIKKTLRVLPWVHDVTIKRQWPDQLLVKIYERIPQARWNNRWLIDQSGNIFIPDHLRNFNHLPALSGVITQENEMWKTFLFLKKRLQTISLTITDFSTDDIDNWCFVTNGVKISVGEHNHYKRIEAFILLYKQQLKGQWSNIDSVDLRYTNGIAIAWKK